MANLPRSIIYKILLTLLCETITLTLINAQPVTFQVDDDNDFKLYPRAKGSFMFVNWNILRRQIRTKKLKIWAHEKTRQTSLLVSWADQMSYVTEAIGKSK